MRNQILTDFIKDQMPTITIIGGGASGLLLLMNLVKRAENQLLEINLIEKKPELTGVAYAAAKPFHLLNVPAAKMGAFPEDVEDFYKWLQANGFAYSPGDFVPRTHYKSYLQSVFAETLRHKPENVFVNVINAEAADVVFANKETRVLLQSNTEIVSDKVILAFGNFLPAHVRTKNTAYTNSLKYFQNPWSAEIPGAIPTSDRVLIIGTGLTAIDAIASLRENKHQNKIYALSTHGLLPTVHQKAEIYPSFQTEIEAAQSVRERFNIVRQHIAKAELNGGNWRAVIDSLRPFTQELWKSFPQVEKKRFLRHLQRRWDVARHRMPTQSARMLDELQADGTLKILRGRIGDIELKNNKFAIQFGEDNRIQVDTIINCTGSISNYAKIEQPLVKNLIGKGDIKPDDLFLGLDATPDGAIINRDGEISGALYTFATAHKGILWECTAMPDIRSQAKKLALRLLAE